MWQDLFFTLLDCGKCECSQCVSSRSDWLGFSPDFDVAPVCCASQHNVTDSLSSYRLFVRIVVARGGQFRPPTTIGAVDKIQYDVWCIPRLLSTVVRCTWQQGSPIEKLRMAVCVLRRLYTTRKRLRLPISMAHKIQMRLYTDCIAFRTAPQWIILMVCLDANGATSR